MPLAIVALTSVCPRARLWPTGSAVNSRLLRPGVQLVGVVPVVRLVKREFASLAGLRVQAGVTGGPSAGRGHNSELDGIPAAYAHTM